MNRTENARRARYTAIGVAVAAAMLLGVMLSGCGSSTPAATETQAPAPAVAAASIAPVWAQVGAAEEPLFSLVVTESQGFSSAERRYLRGLKVSWNIIRQEATECAALAETGDAAALATLAGRIGRQADAAASIPSPSPRFSMLRDSVRLLMRRVARMALLTQDFASATSEEEKVAIATQLTRLATPLAAETLRVADWGIELRNRYGGLYLAAVWYAPVATTPTPAPTSAPTSAPQPQPQPQPQPEPTPTSTPKPDNSITAAEARQIDSLNQLDAWLTAVIDETNTTLASQDLPWSDNRVTSFCLNMGFLQDACDEWLGRSAAGPHMASAYKEYLQGLSLVRKGAGQLNDAAQHNDAGHQKALDAGGKTLDKAAPYLQHGMARLNALK